MRPRLRHRRRSHASARDVPITFAALLRKCFDLCLRLNGGMDEKRELRHDRHTVSLLTDHMVFSPKYRGKMRTGDVAMAPKHSLSYISKMIKGRSSKYLREEFQHLCEWCGEHLWAPSCYHGSVGNGWDVVEKSSQDIYEYQRNKRR